jgi:hypothetical protein
MWHFNQTLNYFWMLSGLLGSIAPCVLYGSNVERLAAGQGTFANSCLPYTGLYMLGKSLFGWNCLAPCFSHPTRTAIRRRYNLEACSPGCCVSFVQSSHLLVCQVLTYAWYIYWDLHCMNGVLMLALYDFLSHLCLMVLEDFFLPCFK